MKHSVFLVEDEIVVRESIRDNIPWEEAGLSLVGEASDGEMALPLVMELKPDILITDIKMPFMDGLELGKLVRKRIPWIKIIVISGYDEFTYAREAITISAADYLLKPLTSEDLLASLKKAVDEIRSEEAARDRMNYANECVKTGRMLMAERFLNDLSTGCIPSAEAIQKSGEFGVSLVSRYYAAVLVRLELKDVSPPAGSGYHEYLKAESVMESMLEGNKDIIKFRRSLKEISLLLKGENAGELKAECYSISNSLKYEINRKTSCSLAASIGGVKERIQGVAESFAEAASAAEFSYIFGKDNIVGIEDTANRGFRGSGEDLDSARPLAQLDSRAFSEGLRSGEKEEITRLLTEGIRRLSLLKSNLLFFTYSVMDMFVILARFMDELGGRAEEFLPEMSELEHIARNGDTEKVRQRLETATSAALDFREQCRKNKYGDVVSRTREFIGDHFADPDMSLTKVADHINMSPSHFSTVFSQETGETFIEYLTGVRIAKAKELLRTTSLRSSEIAYKTGYKDPHYFSYLFKKSTGVTPTDFRQ